VNRHVVCGKENQGDLGRAEPVLARLAIFHELAAAADPIRDLAPAAEGPTAADPETVAFGTGDAQRGGDAGSDGIGVATVDRARPFVGQRGGHHPGGHADHLAPADRPVGAGRLLEGFEES
jgi:hypothetical protein